MSVSRIIVIFLCALGVSNLGRGQDPNEYNQAIAEARQLMSQGSPQSVIEKLRPWLEQFPNRAELRQGLGLAHYQLGEFALAAEHFAVALSVQDEGTTIWKQATQFLGMAHYYQQHWAEAVPLLEKATTWEPEDHDLLHALATSYLNLHDLQSCRLAYARLFQIDPDSPQAFLLAAQIMYRAAYGRDAEELIQEAVQRWPEWTDYSYELAAVAMVKGDYGAVVSHLTRELSRNPANAAAWQYLGEAYFRLSRLDEGKVSLRRAIWLDGRAARPYALLGEIYLVEERFADAEEVLQVAIEIDPNHYEAMFLLARLYHKTNRPELARKHMGMARKLRGK